MRISVAWVCAVLVGFCGSLFAQEPLPVASAAVALQQRALVRWSDVPRKVLAFYYPWYGNPQVSGRWVHWDGVKADQKDIGSSTHFPALGPYDSHDPHTIAQHCDWAKSAGIDVFIASWWGQRDFHDRALPRLLDTAREKGLEICVYYEQVPRDSNPQSAIDDFLYLVQRYGDHPAWLKVHGKPVIFVYERAMGQLSIHQWADVLVQVERKHPPGVFAVADQLSRPAALAFDGVHTYNTCSRLQKKPVGQIAATVHEVFDAPLSTAASYGRVGCVTVIPGYDDTKIRKPGIKTERFEGDSYRRQWQAVGELDPDWVLITSFNEWHEGSEIEPSVEFGDRYLPLTAELAKEWKRGSRRAKASATRSSVTPEDIAALKKKLAHIPIGVLPNAQSDAAYWLVEKGLSPVFLTWEQVLDPKVLISNRFPLLIYAGSENYVQTLKQRGDVDAALDRYSRGGGCIVAMPSMPFPFFYNERGGIADSAAKLGFVISAGSQAGEAGGFEMPPAGLKFAFAQPDMRLPHVAKSFPFPQSGDLRWRPYLGRQLPKGDLYVPLLELRDEQSRWRGDGAVYVEHRVSEPKGSKTCYVWFRLLDSPQGDALLLDLFSFLASQIKAEQ